jgi:hypothetical protein
VKPLWKSLQSFLKKPKIELPYDPAITLLDVCLNECKLAYNREAFPPMMIAALFKT